MCRVTTFPYPIIACPLQKICTRYSSIFFPDLQAIQFSHRPSSLHKWHLYKEPTHQATAHLCPSPLSPSQRRAELPSSSAVAASSQLSSAMVDWWRRRIGPAGSIARGLTLGSGTMVQPRMTCRSMGATDARVLIDRSAIGKLFLATPWPLLLM